MKESIKIGLVIAGGMYTGIAFGSTLAGVVDLLGRNLDKPRVVKKKVKKKAPRKIAA